MIFVLKGKTKKGKDRIKRDGDKFVFIRETPGGKIDLEPVNNRQNWRLIQKENDPDFDIVEILSD